MTDEALTRWVEEATGQIPGQGVRRARRELAQGLASSEVTEHGIATAGWRVRALGRSWHRVISGIE